MAKINLLPWREELREQQKRQFITVCVAIALLAIGAVLASWFYLDQKLKGQEQANQLVGYSGNVSGDPKFLTQLDFPVAIYDMTGISNTRRSSGLKENIEVVKEHDNFFSKIRLLPRLYYVYWYTKMRGK